MRICFVASSFPKHATDGSARFIRSMAEALVDRGHEVDVLIPHHPDLRLPANDKIGVTAFRYVWPSSLAIMGYSEAMVSDTALVPVSYALAPLFALNEARALLSLHRRRRYDIVHAHWVIPNGAVAALTAGVTKRPLVISLHGSDIFFSVRKPLLGKVAGWTMRRAAGVTACSEEIASHARALGARPSALHLLPWGADPARFIAERSEARGQLGITADAQIILSLGRLVKKKGLNVLLQALPAVFARAPLARCVIAGGGPELEPLRTQAAELGIAERVEFAGPVEWNRIPELLAACDVFVAPSVHDENGNVDGLPTTVLEAMAAGRPVVASRVAGMELVVKPGETGMLVPEYDAPALADALATVLEQPLLRAALGAGARRAVEREFNWRNVAARFEQIYEGALRS
jgi:glycosyltransferase involved in cell wall biosynthesis